MRRIIVLSISAAVAFAFTGCKSSESAYKKAWEKAQQEQVTTETEEEPETTEVEVTPISTSQPTEDTSAVSVQTESVTVVSGSGLKAYSVVCGSFSLKANAEGLQTRLSGAGYNAQLAYNAEKNMYRVVASTFDDKPSAVQSRDVLRSTYPDAWILMAQ